MAVEKIPIKVLQEIEENDFQTAINESQPNAPNLHFQDFTTQDVDPEDPELLVTGVIAALPVEFNPLNYVQRKGLLQKFWSSILTQASQKCSIWKVFLPWKANPHI